MNQQQKLLFVCTENRLRSLTAEAMYRGFPSYEVKSAGTEPIARIRVNRGHIGWADLIKLHLTQVHRIATFLSWTR